MWFRTLWLLQPERRARVWAESGLSRAGPKAYICLATLETSQSVGFVRSVPNP